MGSLDALVKEAAKFEVQQDPDGVTVNLDGKLLTRYVIKSGLKPILWPIIASGLRPRNRRTTSCWFTQSRPFCGMMCRYGKNTRAIIR